MDVQPPQSPCRLLGGRGGSPKVGPPAWEQQDGCWACSSAPDTQLFPAGLGGGLASSRPGAPAGARQSPGFRWSAGLGVLQERGRREIWGGGLCRAAGLRFGLISLSNDAGCQPPAWSRPAAGQEGAPGR